MKLSELTEHLRVHVIVAVSNDCHFGNIGVVRFVNLERAYVESAASEELGYADKNAEAVYHAELELDLTHMLFLLRKESCFR